MTVIDQRRHALTGGGIKDLFFLFSPILVMTFSSSLYLFVEKLFFARLSTQALEVAVNASVVCRVFQFPCFFLAMIAQVCVGRWHGAGDLKTIGPGIWQFIWFSFLSLLITIPLSLIYGHYYFQGTSIEAVVWPYFYFLISINFIYPLSATFTCLYLGQGKTRLILWATIGSQIIKIGLAYPLIFGWGWFPSLGLLGGALSTLLAQLGYCCLLFGVFTNPKYVNIYQSWSWRLQPKFFWDCIKPGFLRAMGGILVYLCWASIVRLMTAKGGDYSLILSIGGTLFVFLPFLGDALCQAQTTVVSQLLGAHKYYLLDKAFRSGTILALALISIISLPLVFFPSFTFHYLFPNIMMDEIVITRVFLGVWLSFAFFTIGYIPISYILAYKDTKFSLFMGFLNWIDGYLLMYWAIVKMHIAADQFWIVLTLMHICSAVLFYSRAKWLNSRELVLSLKKLSN